MDHFHLWPAILSLYSQAEQLGHPSYVGISADFDYQLLSFQ